MRKQYESIITLIESKYISMTNTEKQIADYFLSGDVEEDLSSNYVSKKLYVSKAALTRFAKKLGFSGYSEFSYIFEEMRKNNVINDRKIQRPVFDTYQDLLSKSFYLFREDNLEAVANKILEISKLYLYGMGSSGLLAQDFANRLCRLGIDAEAINDSHKLRINHARINENDLAMAISYSGKTEEVLSALNKAKEKKAYTVLVVSNDDEKWREKYDEVLLVAAKKNLDYSNIISPQFPAMILLDMLYGLIIEKSQSKKNIFDLTTKDLLNEIRDDYI